MKLAFDARYLGGASSGIGTYSGHLLRELLQLDRELDLTLIASRRGATEALLSERCRELVFRAAPRSFSTLYRLPIKLRGRGIDLFHGPFNILPSRLPCAGVVTIHDIMQLQNPNNIAKSRFVQQTAGRFWRTCIRHAVARAARVLAVSHATRDALLEYFPELPEDRVSVTPNGVEAYFFEAPCAAELEQARRLVPADRRVVLSVGNESPHKNHHRAVQAFMQAFGERETHHFVLVRRWVRRDSALVKLLCQTEVASRVTLLGHVDRSTLRALYQLAHIFFFPSWVEGFGIPILESMAVGTPVLTSDRSAPLEVAGDAALTASPFSVQQMAQALRTLDSDQRTRRRLVEQGRARTAAFSWKQCATATLEAYRAALRSD